MIRAVLFDLDETLILDEPIQEEAFAAAAQLAAPLGVNALDLARRAREIADRLWREGPYYAYCHRIGHSAGEGLWARYDRGDHPAIAGLRAWAPRYRLAVWQQALQEQGVNPGEAVAGLPAAMAERFQQVRRRHVPYPEVEGLLTALKAKGYLLGIVTNGVPDLQREKLAGCGLAHFFQAVAISGEIDCGKPDPGIFRHIAGELGVAPSECAVVGDNPHRDIAGAMAAGMRSVWVRRHRREGDPRYPGDLACSDLSALLTWLEDLGR